MCGGATQAALPAAHISTMTLLPETIHVLLVDDEQLSRFVVGNLLRKCNYAVTVVDSGAQALDILSRSAPGTFQLILTDLMMPEVDGLDILRYVRSNNQLEDLPVIMMSANEQKDTVFQAIQGGAEEYLVKPVTRKEVQNIWQYVWKRVKAAQQQQQHGQEPPQQQQQQQQAAQPAGLGRLQQAVQALRTPSQPLPVSAPVAATAAPAPASGTTATAAAGAAAALHLAGSSRGMRHLQQQQKLLQQQHEQHQLQHRQQRQAQQQQQQPTLQQQELMRSMQQLHQAQQPLVFQPDRCSNGNLHSKVLMGALATSQQEQQRQPVSLQQVQQRRSLPQKQQEQQQQQEKEQRQQQQQQSDKEDFESLAFFLSTLHQQRSAQAAAVRASLGDLDAQIAAVQSALQQLEQPGAAGGLLAAGPGLFSERPASAGSGSIGETAPAAQPAAAADTRGAVAGAAVGAGSRAGSKRMAEDTDDEDDLEMERRERGRHCKRQRLCSAVTPQPHLSSTLRAGAAGREGAADTAGQLQLARCASSNVNVLQLPEQQEAGGAVVAADAAAAAADGPAPSAAAAAADAVGAAAGPEVSQESFARWRHVSSKFDTLNAIYQRHQQAAQQQQQQDVVGPSSSNGKARDSSVPCSSAAGALPGYLQGFGDDLWSYGRYSRLAVRGTVRAAADLLGGGSSMVCAAAFDRDDEYVAIAGVSKRIRIFEYAAITSGSCGAQGCTAAGRAAGHQGSSSSLSGVSEGPGLGGAGGFGAAQCGSAPAAQDGGVVYPVLELSSRSRLSCVSWSPYIKAQLASSDYEGVVQLWDANTGCELMQLEEHSKRAWCVDFSRLEPTRLVSSSDDGTVKLWSIHQEASVATLQLHANVCSVQFSPESPHLLAAGCANYRFYLYDLRNTKQPLVCVPGHRRSVSYVKWLNAHQLVTASTDNTLRRWDVRELMTAASSSSSATREIGGAAVAAACRMTYWGHTNNRNFIGLSVLPDALGAAASAAGSGSGSGSGGYIVCGSESNEAYVYHSAVPVPITSHSFSPLSLPWGQKAQRGAGRASCGDLGALADLTDAAVGGKSDLFVSCVAWNRKHSTLVAANSAGHIQVLELA